MHERLEASRGYALYKYTLPFTFIFTLYGVYLSRYVTSHRCVCWCRAGVRVRLDSLVTTAVRSIYRVHRLHASTAGHVLSMALIATGVCASEVCTSHIHPLVVIMGLQEHPKKLESPSKFNRGLSRLLHTELHWLDVPERVVYKLGVVVFNCLHGQAPQYLVELCQPGRLRRDTRTRGGGTRTRARTYHD